MPQMGFVAVAVPTRSNHEPKDTCQCGKPKMVRSKWCWSCQTAWPDRFWRRVEKTETCWNWIGQIVAGYGVISFGGKSQKAHRISWEMEHGPIPEGLTIDHLCRNKRCIRPDPSHLEPVTNTVNIRRGNGLFVMNARKTHCNHGHPFISENTDRDPRGNRRCRTCMREADRRHREKVRFAPPAKLR